MRVVVEENKKVYWVKINEQMISFLFIEPYFNSRKFGKNNGEKPQVW